MVQKRILLIASLAVGASLLAIISFMGSISTLDGTNPNSNGRNLPQESRAIKIEITHISGSPVSSGGIAEVLQTQPVNVTAVITNTGNSSFTFSSLTEGLAVYDSFNNVVMKGDSTQDMINAITLQKGETFALTQTWNLKKISYVNSEPHFVDAPVGRYTILVSFGGGGIEIADSVDIRVL